MTSREFFAKVIAKAEEIAQSKNAKVEVYRKGDKATNEEEATFIRSTNMRYYQTEGDELLGDFININLDKSFVRFSIENLSKTYINGNWEDVEATITEQLDYAHGIKNTAEDVIERLGTYSRIKENLIIRPLNYDYNRHALENAVYKKIGDIALVLYAVILDDRETNCLNTVKVPKEVFEKWNLDFEQVFVSTLLNTNVFAMPRMFKNLLDIENTADEESAFMSTLYTGGNLKPETIPLITTTRKTNGAISIFYPGVKEKIAEMFDDSFYVAFTSIHEAMLHKKGTIDPSSIRRHVRATNRTFGPEDTLSNEVYLYNKDTGEFAIA